MCICASGAGAGGGEGQYSISICTVLEQRERDVTKDTTCIQMAGAARHLKFYSCRTVVYNMCADCIAADRVFFLWDPLYVSCSKVQRIQE
jgi:hypothetical protein